MLEAGKGDITSDTNITGQFDGQTTESELDKNKKKDYDVPKTQNNLNSNIHDDVTASTRKVSTVRPIKRYKLIDIGDENTRNESCLVGGYESKVFGIQRYRNSKQKIQEDKFPSAISTQISNKSKSLSTTSHTLSNKVSRDSVQGIIEDGKILRRNKFADPKDIKKTNSKYYPVVQKVGRSESLRKSFVLSTSFKCHLCTNVYKSNRSLKAHLKIHSEKHQCEHCGICCTSNSLLVRHYRTHNGEKPHACKLCDKTFSCKSSLNKHNLVHTGYKKHVCLFCQKQFTQSSHLATHIRTHTKEKPYACKLCGATFSLKQTLTRHNVVHTQEKKFICEFCQKRFTQRFTLATHIIIHTGTKLYGCNLCTKTFSLQSHLNTHNLVHSGVKKHICEFCQKQFALFYTLATHIRTHTREKPYGCDICSKTFSQSSNLIRHKRHCHNI